MQTHLYPQQHIKFSQVIPDAVNRINNTIPPVTISPAPRIGFRTLADPPTATRIRPTRKQLAVMDINMIRMIHRCLIVVGEFSADSFA